MRSLIHSKRSPPGPAEPGPTQPLGNGCEAKALPPGMGCWRCRRGRATEHILDFDLGSGFGQAASFRCQRGLQSPVAHGAPSRGLRKHVPDPPPFCLSSLWSEAGATPVPEASSRAGAAGVGQSRAPGAARRGLWRPPAVRGGRAPEPSDTQAPPGRAQPPFPKSSGSQSRSQSE